MSEYEEEDLDAAAAAAAEVDRVIEGISVKSGINEDEIRVLVTHEELGVTVGIQADRGDMQAVVLASILKNLPEMLMQVIEYHIKAEEAEDTDTDTDTDTEDPLEVLWRASPVRE